MLALKHISKSLKGISCTNILFIGNTLAFPNSQSYNNLNQTTQPQVNPHAMFQPPVYGQPQVPPVYNQPQANFPPGMVGQMQGTNQNIPGMNNVLQANYMNKPAAQPLNNSYNVEPNKDFNDRFNHSMNLGQNMKFNNTMTNAPPGLTNYQNTSMGYNQLGQFGGGPLNQTLPSYYPMNSQLSMNTYQPPGMTSSSPPVPQGLNPETRKPGGLSANKDSSQNKPQKTGLKTGSRTFKPASMKTGSNSFYKKEPKAHLSYMQSPPTSNDLLGQSAIHNYPNDMTQANPMNNTFQGALPNMMGTQGLNMTNLAPVGGTMNTSYTKPNPNPMIPTGSQVTGRLKYFKENDNYGFIVSDLDGENIFFHYSEMKNQSLSKEFLTQAKDTYIIRLVFQVIKYVGKYKLSKKAVNIYVTEVTPYSQSK